METIIIPELSGQKIIIPKDKDPLTIPLGFEALEDEGAVIAYHIPPADPEFYRRQVHLQYWKENDHSTKGKEWNGYPIHINKGEKMYVMAFGDNSHIGGDNTRISD